MTVLTGLGGNVSDGEATLQYSLRIVSASVGIFVFEFRPNLSCILSLKIR